MYIRLCKVGGWTFTFNVPRRKLVDVQGYTTAHGDYWNSLAEALRLVFGANGG
jgi:hypothetical protein